MATATLTLTLNNFPSGVDNTQRRQILDGIAALSAGGTYATNGIPFTWNFVNAEGGAFVPGFSTPVPVYALFMTKASGLVEYWYDSVHNTLRISLGGVELANGAAITADTILFHVEFPRGV